MNRSAASISGVVSPTPTLIAMKLRPQTIATLTAARMSRALMPAFTRSLRQRAGERHVAVLLAALWVCARRFSTILTAITEPS